MMLSEYVGIEVEKLGNEDLEISIERLNVSKILLTIKYDI